MLWCRCHLLRCTLPLCCCYHRLLEMCSVLLVCSKNAASRRAVKMLHRLLPALNRYADARRFQAVKTEIMHASEKVPVFLFTLQSSHKDKLLLSEPILRIVYLLADPYRNHLLVTCEHTREEMQFLALYCWDQESHCQVSNRAACTCTVLVKVRGERRVRVVACFRKWYHGWIAVS